MRPLFEPTDLELEDAGTVEADLQLGLVRGDQATRLVIPDLELDLGLTRNLEVDLDGAYALEGPEGGAVAFSHAAPDSLWLAAKLGLVSWDGGDTGFGLGLQAGPKFPVAPGTSGLGFEVLALVGARRGRMHLALNAGTFVDPHPGPGQPRDRGLEGGLDLDLDLDAAGAFSLTAELGGVHFFSTDPEQLVLSGGVSWAVLPVLELSVAGLRGVLGGGDRYGILVGVSPKFSLSR